MHRLYIIALSAIGAMFLLAAALQPDGDAAPAGAPQAKSAPAESRQDADDTGGSAQVLKRDSSGQFRLTATVNGSDVRFLVDTGADMVALTEQDAETLGISPSSADFQPVLKTASGTGYGAPVTLERIEVAGTELHDVQAMVVQGLETNLLGQSVLKRLGTVELSGDKMIIRPR